MRNVLNRLVLVLALLLPAAARARDADFRTSDGVRLHIIEAGQAGRNTIVFVPGLGMPAWMFQPQLQAFAARYHVVALDPRGQGESEIAASGYDHLRRGRDIAELIGGLGGRPVVLVGWSLGVLDSLAYIRQFGDARVAGLVLVDNSVGEDPAPVPFRGAGRRGPALPRDEKMRRFVRGLFARDPGEAYRARLTEDALHTPPEVTAALSNYNVPRSYWRDAVWSVRRPILYMVRPRFAEQAANLALHQPLAETVLFATAGHALFVDEPARFDAILQDFIARRVWP